MLFLQEFWYLHMFFPISTKDFSPGGGDGWGIFFLPTGQALVFESQLIASMSF